MEKNTKLKRLTIDIPESDHRELKTEAARMGVSMTKLVRESILALLVPGKKKSHAKK